MLFGEVLSVALGALRANKLRSLLTVNPGQQRGMGVVIQDQQVKLTMKDAEALAERGEHFTSVQPEMARNQQVTFNNKNTNVSIVGTSPNYLEVRKFKLKGGRMFGEARMRVLLAGSRGISCDALGDRLLREVEVHSGRTVFEDDVCLVTIEAAGA